MAYPSINGSPTKEKVIHSGSRLFLGLGSGFSQFLGEVSKQTGEWVLEKWVLVILAYIGWGVGNSRRLLLQRLSTEDWADFSIALWLSFTGYFWCQFLVGYPHRHFFGRKMSFFSSSLVTLVLVFVWETFSFWLYATFYKWQSILDTAYFPSDAPLILVVLLGMIAYVQAKRYIRSSAYALTSQPNSLSASPEVALTVPAISLPAQNTSEKADKKANLTSLLVSKGKARVMIFHNEFGFFLTRDKLVWLFTGEGEKYLIDYTLSELEELLNPIHFFRINRQVIVSRKAVKGYISIENQKLLLQSSFSLLSSEYCIISKYTGPEFKSWLAMDITIGSNRENTERYAAG